MSGPPQSPRSIHAEPGAIEGFSEASEDLVGRLLDGRYLVDSVLGRGGMAIVLAARHVFLGRRVAVKVLHPQLLALDEMKARFLREARAASLVQHPSVIAVTDFGVATTSGGSLHYLVMEHLDGEDLLTWSERRGMASAEEVRAIGIQLAEALAAVHGAGYVHRDVKPENVWVLAEPDGAGLPRIKLLDFGIAAVIDDPAVGHGSGRGRPHRLTAAGQTLGTALYMSPEQALGGRLDGRSDVYAVGSVLWELACDACMFDGTSPMDIMQKQTAARPAPPSAKNPEIPAWLDTIVMRCLEKRPDDRFADALALRDALVARRVIDVEVEVEREHEGEVEHEHEHDNRGRVGWWIAGGIAAVALAVVLIARPWSHDVAPLTTTPIPAATHTTAAPEPEPTPTAAAVAAPDPEPIPDPAATIEPTIEPTAAAPTPALVTPEPAPDPAPASIVKKPYRPRTTPVATAPATTSPTTTPPTTPGSELWRPERPVSPP